MAGKRWPTQCALLPQRTLTTSRIVWAFGARRLIYIQGSGALLSVSKASSVSLPFTVQMSRLRAHRQTDLDSHHAKQHDLQHGSR
jgi:hypothetical protein